MTQIFINNLNSYVSQAIFQELRNDIAKGEEEEPSDSPNVILATNVDKDSSDKPQGITKMLKVSEEITRNIEVQTYSSYEVLEQMPAIGIRSSQWKPKRCGTCSKR